MREIMDDGRQLASDRNRLAEAPSGSLGRFPVPDHDVSEVAPPDPEAAPTSTRSDWMVLGRERAEAASTTQSLGLQTAQEPPTSELEVSLNEQAPPAEPMADVEEEEEEEFLTVGELAKELHYVERRPRTTRAVILDRSTG